eukprot:2142048-Alexandrium_andersonii.AAC.1
MARGACAAAPLPPGPRCLSLPARTPRVLWQMCREGEPPVGLSWGQLCDGLTVRDVALTGRRPDDLGL